MKKYSSTTIKRFTSNCPAALGFMESGAEEFREIFQGGIAAHAVLQVVGEKGAQEPAQQRRVGEAVTQELITVGRAFKDRPEPPMNPEDAIEGRDLALRWLSWNELVPDTQYECWLGMGEDGAPCGGADGRYSAIIDRMYWETQGDEDFEQRALVVSDYKSAWPTDASELETLQRKGQAVLGWLHHPDAHAITQEVINLRTGGKFRNTIQLDDEGLATLQRWRDDLLHVCTAADLTRAARPGIGCVSCPYILQCEDASALVVNEKAPPVNRYAAALGVTAALAPVLRKQAKDKPLPDQFGGYIGYQATAGRAVDLVEFAGQVAAFWHGDLTGLVLALQPGVTSVDKLAKVLFPGKEGKLEREDFLEACVKPARGSKFTTWIGG